MFQAIILTASVSQTAPARRGQRRDAGMRSQRALRARTLRWRSFNSLNNKIRSTDAPAPSADPAPPVAQPPARRGFLTARRSPPPGGKSPTPARASSPPTRKSTATARAGQRGGPRRKRRGWRWELSMHTLVSEFVATSFFIGLGVGAPYSAWSFGLLYVANGIIFGSVSGAHMNPGVTLAAAINDHMSWPTAGAYMCAQFLGGILGMGLLYALRWPLADLVCLGCTLPGLLPLPAVVLEFGATALFVLVCCATWDVEDEYEDVAAPYKIGLTLSGLIFITDEASGGSVNVVRSFAPALINWYWDRHWIYWLGPFGGAAMAALMYRLLLRRVPHREMVLL